MNLPWRLRFPTKNSRLMAKPRQKLKFRLPEYVNPRNAGGPRRMDLLPFVHMSARGYQGMRMEVME